MNYKKHNSPFRKTSLKLQYNIAISDYKNGKISKDEFIETYYDLYNKYCEYVLENELQNIDSDSRKIIPLLNNDWRDMMEVIEIVEMGSNEKYQNGRIELTQLKMVG